MSSDDSLPSIHIGRAGRCITITFIEPPFGPPLADRLARRGYPYPVKARIEAVADGFRAHYLAGLYGGEFAEFREALARLYSFESKEAKFDTLTGEVKIEIKGDGRGHFSAKCVAREHTAEVFPCLTFTLEFDQTDIPRMLAELDAALGRAP
jgi:hypothetical protein